MVSAPLAFEVFCPICGSACDVTPEDCGDYALACQWDARHRWSLTLIPRNDDCYTHEGTLEEPGACDWKLQCDFPHGEEGE